MSPRSRGLTPHPDKVKLDALMPCVREFQAIATKHGIGDIFQDNGGKQLQLILTLGLKSSPGREGNDAIDEDGNEYELKTVNTKLTKSFSTHHHLNPTIIDKYRKVAWYFAEYEGIELKAIYRMEPADLEPKYLEWATKWEGTGKDINNPKIQLSFVKRYGKLVYSTPVTPLPGAQEEMLVVEPKVEEET